MQTAVFCTLFLHFSHISVNSGALSLARGSSSQWHKPSHTEVRSAAQEQMVPPHSTPGRLAVLHKNTCSHLLGRPRRQSSGHSDPFQVLRALSWVTTHFRGGIHPVSVFTLSCQNRWTLRTFP